MNRIERYIFTLIALISVLTVYGFEPTTYREQSRMSEGRWVKVSVSQSGMHLITTEQLRTWGFTDPSAVRVYGYGGGRMSDLLSLETYYDDLPAVQSVQTPRGIVFYATGPYRWVGPTAEGDWYKQLNPYSSVGYYFLSDSGEETRPIPTERGRDNGEEAATTVRYSVHYETDEVSPGETGHILLGEDFRFTPQRTFTFDLPGRVASSDVSMRCSFFTKVPTTVPSLSFTANGTAIGRSSLKQTTTSAYGDSTLIVKSFGLGSDTRLALGLNYSSNGTTLLAHLNYLTINYERNLSLPTTGVLEFRSSAGKLKMGGNVDHVWDVTNPLSIVAMDVSAGTWTTPYSGSREYAAWNEEGTFGTVTFAGNVSNQSLHGMETPDMIILSPSSWASQAERIAQVHRTQDSMRVHVFDPQTVYNEFGSGVADVGAIRRMLKYFYDLGSDEEGHRLQYVLLMSRASYDHRHLTTWMKTSGWENIPIWQSDGGSDDTYSYCSDDMIAMLDDNTGLQPGTAKLSVSVGRMPVRNVDEARLYADKLVRYALLQQEGQWKNKMVILADDRDSGIHLEQAEAAIARMQETPSGESMIYNKVYVDAYEEVGGITVAARDKMYRWLDEGAAWWWYIGHASIDAWTGEGMLTRTDLMQNMYFKRLPILYAATCTFSRYDGSEECGAELLTGNETGGVIASICPTRPVYITSNGIFTENVGRVVFQRDETGRYLTIGEIMRQAKNKGGNDTNRLRYVLIGDPALRAPMPENQIVLTSINGEDVGEDNLPTVAARQQATFKGHLTDYAGNALSDFNGSLYITVYDAEESVTTLGRGDESDPGKECVFEQQGSRLYTGRGTVVNGEFETIVAMPSEIAWNYRNAAVNLYAVSEGGNREAIGVNRQFYVYGLDESHADDVPPTIEALYLNHETFKSGDVVNESPVVFASVSDDIGINLSQSGIGHALWMRVDNQASYIDVSDFYTPEADGSAAGLVVYPLENLSAGNHTLSFRVWDTSNNVAESSIEFYVEPGLAPKIFDVYTDANPARTEANFYLRHNRPDATVTVTIRVYDIAGRPVWSSTRTGRSDMFVTTPITWDLRDGVGRRVPRGIYVYRAELTTDGEHHTSTGRRIAVCAE